MFIHKLEIQTAGVVTRTIHFHNGLNLIVDSTAPLSADKNVTSGNGVGKTTVLRLINYCLGADSKSIFKDSESGKNNSKLIDHLQMQRVMIRLTLVESSADDKQHVIERNFMNGAKDKIQRIDGKQIKSNQDFSPALGQMLLGLDRDNKPSFRTIVARNMRIDPPALDNTLRFVSEHFKDVQYETLFLYMFGITVQDRDPVVRRLKSEKLFLKRLEKTPREELSLSLTKVNDDLSAAEERLEHLNIDPDYQMKLKQLDALRYQRTVIANQMTNYRLKQQLIQDAQAQVEAGVSQISEDELAAMYGEAQTLLPGLSVSFAQLVDYNNRMITARSEFIGKELPSLQDRVDQLKQRFDTIDTQLNLLADQLKSGHTNEELVTLSARVGQYYEDRGRLLSQIEQIDRSREQVTDMQKQLEKIDQDAFSDATHDRIENQLAKLNRYFYSYSEQMYGKATGIAFKVKHRGANRVWDFYPFSPDNPSSGKKQGEIAAFDLSYVQFARDEAIPVLEFGLYDQRELMHGNQLIQVADFAQAANVQMVLPILADKLPAKLNDDQYIVLRLSQQEKLFGF